MAKATKHGVEPGGTGAQILRAVENQLAENSPPQVTWTLERQLAEGIEREEALKYIACALSVEIFEVLKHGATYDEARYLRNLARLPELPWEGEQFDLALQPTVNPLLFAAVLGRYAATWDDCGHTRQRRELCVARSTEFGH